jgi:hypothetical protein
MQDLPKKAETSGPWSWSTNLLVDAVGQLSLFAGLAVLAVLIVREIVSKNRGALPGQKVV